MSDLTFSVSGYNENPTKFVVKARNFELVIDEPEALGGTNHAANPVEYILAGYAGCLNVMGHIVARELGFELKRLEIKIEGDLNPAKVFGQPTDDRAGYKEIRVQLIPDADIDEPTFALWFKTLESRCPVNDNLSNTTPIKVDVVRKERSKAA